MKKNVPKLLYAISFYSMIGVLSQVLFTSLASANDSDTKQIQGKVEVAEKISPKSNMLLNKFEENEAISQTRTITGKVTSSEDNSDLPGVSVLIKGTTTGTVTGVDGRYALDVSEGSVLVFSYVGFTSEEVEVGNKSVIDLVLRPDLTQLSEIVVVGYGTQEKQDITGAVGSVKSADFNKGIINSPGQLLQGKVSGVNVTSSSGAPGTGQRIIIRGQGSIRQSTGPLFVVDGFPLGLAGTGAGQSPYELYQSRRYRID